MTKFVIGEDSIMRKTICAGLFAVLFAPVMAAAQAPKGLCTEEFGMSPRELQAIEKTEELIARCMPDPNVRCGSMLSKKGLVSADTAASTPRTSDRRGTGSVRSNN
jgi:hypothetical protein